MKKELWIFIFLTFTFNLTFSQRFFKLSNTTFEVGQIYRDSLIYELSGGCPLSPQSFPKMDSIIVFLKLNPNISVEFGTNTDYRGDSIMNLIRSELRAECLIDYCIIYGISIERLTHKGYGETNPIIVDEEIYHHYPFLKLGQQLTESYILSLAKVEYQEIANKLNRRTELKIIKVNE